MKHTWRTMDARREHDRVADDRDGAHDGTRVPPAPPGVPIVAASLAALIGLRR